MNQPDDAHAQVMPSTAGRLRLLRVGQVALELDGLRVWLPDGRHVALPPREFTLLRILMENAGRVLTRSELERRVCAAGGISPRYLTVLVRQLRARLASERRPGIQYIRAVRSVGYVFDDPPYDQGHSSEPGCHETG